jgi:long-subunit fatty acid transport protein
MNGRWYAYVPVLAGILMSAVTPTALLAEDGFVAPQNELPTSLTTTVSTGARAAGMGFVSVAVADDGTAILANPAALTRLNRVELAGGFKRSSTSIEGVMGADGYSSDLSSTDFTSLRFAYPFPTFRGSLVFGLSYERIYDLGGDWLAEYDAPVPWEGFEGVWHRTEDYLADGGINALSAACGVDISPKLSLGVTLSYLSGDYSRTYRHTIESTEGVPEYRYEAERHFDSDISGVRATVGAIFYASEQVSAGLAIDSPVSLTFDGTANVHIEDSSFRAVQDTTVLFSDKVSLPFAFRGGVSYSPTDLIVVGADLTYSDWSEIDYAGRITEVQREGGRLRRRSLYKDKLGYGVGVEVSVPSWPLRVRAGYASRPIAYDGLEITSDRSFFTVGAGVLIDTVLDLDVAVVTGSYERKDPAWNQEEKVDESGVLVEATYRF